MRKSVILPGVAVAGGLVGLLVRRVYLAHGFEAGTGLPISGAPSLWAMVLVSAAVAAALLVLSRGKHRKFDQCYTGAFSPDTTPLLSGALAGAVLLAIGGFLALAAWAGSPRTLLGQRTMSIAWAGLGVLSLLAAAGISASKPVCWLRGAAAYLRCGISDGAFLDGATGRRIAAIRAKAAVAAYEAARRINRPAARPEANTDAGK